VVRDDAKLMKYSLKSTKQFRETEPATNSEKRKIRIIILFFTKKNTKPKTVLY
jgi:hypothetical protein